MKYQLKSKILVIIQFTRYFINKNLACFGAVMISSCSSTFLRQNRCSRLKPGTCRHFSFATNPVLNNFTRKINFYTISHFSAKIFWRRLFFENEINLFLNYYGTQLKLKNSLQNSFKSCNISTFNCFFLL